MFSVEQLRQRLPGVAPAAPPIERPLRSGLRALDALLGPDGLAAGQTVEWVGAPSCGKTGMLRALVAGARRQGIAVALVDARRQLMPADWVDHAPGRLWVIRPPDPREGLFCAEIALRTRCFGLVIVDGAPSPATREGVRLQRLARQATSTLLLVRTPEERPSGGRVHQRFAFAGQIEPTLDALARRGPLTWQVTGARVRGGTPGERRMLHLVEAPPDRLAPYDFGADRPGGRTRAGARYGR